MKEPIVEKRFSLIESFQNYFTVEFARTEEQKKEIYQVRYRVYCDEFGYESRDLFPDFQEKDEFDEYSFHCIIIHKSSQKPAGCVRLVPSIKGNKLPFEKHCAKSLDQQFISNLNLDRDSVCEISRLAVDRLFRRRSGDELTRFGELTGLDCSMQEQRTFSIIAIAAFLASTALTELSTRTSVFAMMEPFLPRMLKRSGIIFQKAGYDMNYHGIRSAYFIRTEHALEHMNPELRDLYNWIYNQLNSSFRSYLETESTSNL